MSKPTPTAARLIDGIIAWAEQQPSIRGVALVGSHARSAARADSDVDLMILVTSPELFRDEHSWVKSIAWRQSGVQVERWRDEA